MFAGMCLIDIYGAGKTGITAVKGYTKNTGKTIMNSLGNKLKSIKGNIFGSTDPAMADAAAAEAERLAAATDAGALGLGGKVEGVAIVQLMKKDTLNSGIVKYLKAKYITSGKTADDIFLEETLHMQGLINSGKVTEADYFVLKSGFLEEWNFIEKGIGKPTFVDLTAMLADKSVPGLAEKLLGKVNPDALSKFIKYAGADSVASYYLSAMDSKLGKFIKLHPNSLVLGMPAAKNGEEPEKLSAQNIIPKPANIVFPEKQNLVELGRPVVLMKEGWNVPTPFYLASPCIADLTIEAKTITCGSYIFNKLSGEATCNTPTKDENEAWYNFLTGEVPNCGSILADLNDARTNRFKVTAANIVSNLYNAGTDFGSEVTLNDGTKRIKIGDPIDGIQFYYDKDSQTIDHIGATIKVKGEDGKDTGSYAYDQWKVSYFFNAAKNAGKDMYWLLNNDGDRITLFFSPKWDSSTTQLNPYKVTPAIIKSTGNGFGFKCDRRKMNKDDKIESFISGPAEFSDSTTDYLVCNSPEIVDKGVGVETPATKWRMYFDVNGNFYGIYVSKDYSHFVLWDSNSDHKIDTFAQFYLFTTPGSEQGQIGYEKFNYRVFSDNDFDGIVDGLESSNCNIPQAVTITVDKKKQTDANGYNYCYKSRSSAWGAVSTTLMFAGSAIAKTGGWGMAAGIGLDCGIAILEIWNPNGAIKSTWPRG
jgi:hypothetical protein